MTRTLFVSSLIAKSAASSNSEGRTPPRRRAGAAAFPAEGQGTVEVSLALRRWGETTLCKQSPSMEVDVARAAERSFRSRTTYPRRETTPGRFDSCAGLPLSAD